MTFHKQYGTPKVKKKCVVGFPGLQNRIAAIVKQAYYNELRLLIRSSEIILVPKLIFDSISKLVLTSSSHLARKIVLFALLKDLLK